MHVFNIVYFFYILPMVALHFTVKCNVFEMLLVSIFI